MSEVQKSIASTMNASDEELDRDWKPNGRRPQSTIARSFSAELMDIFRIDNSLADLDEQVEKRKQTVTTQETELQALERQIREMEERLKLNGATPPAQRTPADQAPVQKDLAQRVSRPGTAKSQQQPHHGGAMPPTPTASEGEYELVPELHNNINMSSSAYTCNDSESGLETRSFADMVLVSKDGDHDS